MSVFYALNKIIFFKYLLKEKGSLPMLIFLLTQHHHYHHYQANYDSALFKHHLLSDKSLQTL